MWSDNLCSELQADQVCLDFQRPAERQPEQHFREESREPMDYHGGNLWQHSPYEDQGHHNQNIHEMQAAKLLCLQNDKQLVTKLRIHVTAWQKYMLCTYIVKVETSQWLSWHLISVSHKAC